jgi:hypothetical protein
MLRKALARFSGRPWDESSPPPSRWTIWVAGALALVLGFLVTLWLTMPAHPPSTAAKSMTQSQR